MAGWLRVLWSRARGLITRRRLRLEDEAATHIALLAERFESQGMSPAEAERAARLQFGSITLLQESGTEMQTFAAFEQFWQDLRYGGRVLARNPGFAAVAFLTLALGIGANTATFSLVEALLLRPLPYPGASSIVVPATIFQRMNSDRGSVAYADIADWKAQPGLFDAVSAFRRSDVDVAGGSEPERVRGLAVDEDYFRVMGAPPALGRAPGPAENHFGAHRVVVLSYSFWMRRFGGDPNAVGSKIEIGGVPYTVVGVAAKRSIWPDEAEIIRPLAVDQFPRADLERRDNHIFNVVARLRPGVSIEQAQAKLTVMGARIARENVSRAGTNWKLHSLRDYIVGPGLRRTVVVLFAASLAVLLIACANVASLLLVRGAARGREVMVRIALGAGWRRLASQFLAESAALALTGGVAGVLLGYWGLAELLRFAPAGAPLIENARVDWGVLAFTAGLCLAATILAGTGPAIRAAKSAPAAFPESSRGATLGVRSGRVRSVLVVSQLALALVLLAAAGLLIRTFQNLQHIDPGFPTGNLLTLRLALPASRYRGAEQTTAGFDRIASSLRRIPGVKGAAGAGSLPVDGGGFYLGRAFLREGQPEPPVTSDAHALWNVVQPGWLETVGIRFIGGRAFDDRDTKNSTPVMIVSQSMARELFPNQNPIGRRVRSWRDENVYREIVGVVSDVRYDELPADLGNTVYVPYAQDNWGSLMMTIRTAGDPLALLPSIRREIWSFDPKLSISEPRTMQQIVDAGLSRARLSMFLLAVFGAIALLLAAIGIYGVVAYAVAQRTREIGIRMALGAARRDVLRMMTQGALRLAVSGVACGLVGALALTRLMRTLLYGVGPSDLRTFATVAALLVAVTLGAAFVPARRATRVDPIVTLRHE